MDMLDRPVMFAPGFAKLATNLLSTGSGHDDEDDRDFLGRSLRGQCSGLYRCDHRVDSEIDEFRRLCRKSFVLLARIAVLERHIPSFDVPKILETLDQRRKVQAFFLCTSRMPKHADFGNSLGLLCARGVWPRCGRT